MNFSDIHRRLARYALRRIQCGAISERALARRAGISQPHLHNILKGKRGFSFLSADMVMEALDLTVEDLLRETDNGGILR